MRRRIIRYTGITIKHKERISAKKVEHACPSLLARVKEEWKLYLLAMPIALLLGLKREAVGDAHSINREMNLTLMQDMFGTDSPEA